MPGPRSAVTKPTTEELARFTTSPAVSIYVGDKKKPYSLPIDLLAYYSPYFKACFRLGAFKEGIEGVLRLEDERPEFFEVLIEYMFSRCTKKKVKEMFESRDCMAINNSFIDVCFEFISFCDRYDICEASCAVASHANTFLFEINPDDLEDQLDFVFSRLHNNNPALVAIASSLDYHRRKPDPLSVRPRDFALKEHVVSYIQKHDAAIGEYVKKSFREYAHIIGQELTRGNDSGSPTTRQESKQPSLQ